MTAASSQDTRLNGRTAELIHAYYDGWINGGDSFDERRLREILATDLLFEGPVAGRRTGVDPFLRALSRISRSVKEVRWIREVGTGNDVAVLYECDLAEPEGTHRFAEFLRVEGDRIQEIRLVFDATTWR